MQVDLIDFVSHLQNSTFEVRIRCTINIGEVSHFQ